jgi:hypothetical protein
VLLARRDWWLKLLDLLRVRARTTHDIVRQASTYFSAVVEYDAEAVARHWKDRAGAASILSAVRDRLATTDWESAAMEEAPASSPNSVSPAARCFNRCGRARRPAGESGSLTCSRFSGAIRRLRV